MGRVSGYPWKGNRGSLSMRQGADITNSTHKGMSGCPNTIQKDCVQDDKETDSKQSSI